MTDYEKRGRVRMLLWDWGQVLDLIDRKRHEIETFREWASDADTLRAVTITGMPRGSGTSDPTAEAAMMLEQRGDSFRRAEKAAQVEIDAMLRRKAAMDELIATLTTTQQRILSMKYIDGHKWRYIALKMNYDERSVRRHECAAVCKLAGMMEFSES